MVFIPDTAICFQILFSSLYNHGTSETTHYDLFTWLSVPIKVLEESFSSSILSLEPSLRPSWFCVYWETWGDNTDFLLPNGGTTWLWPWRALSLPLWPGAQVYRWLGWECFWGPDGLTSRGAFGPEAPAYVSSPGQWGFPPSAENVASLSPFPGAAVRQKHGHDTSSSSSREQPGVERVRTASNGGGRSRGLCRRNSWPRPGPHCFQNLGSPYHSHHPNLFKDGTIRNTIGELMS